MIDVTYHRKDVSGLVPLYLFRQPHSRCPQRLVQRLYKPPTVNTPHLPGPSLKLFQAGGQRQSKPMSSIEQPRGKEFVKNTARP